MWSVEKLGRVSGIAELVSPAERALILPAFPRLFLISRSRSWTRPSQSAVARAPGQARSCPGLASPQPRGCSEPGEGGEVRITTAERAL